LIEINYGVRFSRMSSHQVNRRNSTAASFYVVLQAGRRSAPRMLAALAGVVHDCQCADSHEHSRDEDNE
jgi:hypothetical protein